MKFNNFKIIKIVYLLAINFIVLQSAAASDEKLELIEFMSMTEKALNNPNIARKLKHEFSKWSDDERKVITLRLRDNLAEFSQLSPMQLDEYKTLDSVLVAKNSVTQRHTLTKVFVELFSKNEIVKEMKGMIKNNACTTPVSGMLILMGYSFIYSYYDEDGRYYSSLIVSPKECGY